MKIEDYIESGILETFVMGAASDDEVKQLLYMKASYPQVDEALQQLEKDMERIAMNMAIAPPPNTWNKIEQEINDIILRDKTEPQKFSPKREHEEFNGNKAYNNQHQYIEVEAESSHMKIHKNWKWVFAAIFVLGKIFLGCAIYFYLENRQAQQQLQELKTELKQVKK
ncbi:hypothetical protein [Mucilaginibacter sp. FT3.2]|uniref:hypothetical protein n=1 Tax=Mucilaginibacter sp. FT3.2 TaxID=2723090 RepID=UPI00161B09FF|nr:hypothetical protein [Mucilaginibacter sp. FT3.2]MBB6231664.1 hypothetical protein [Mucilaginibacter sp. FT3.2]